MQNQATVLSYWIPRVQKERYQARALCVNWGRARGCFQVFAKTNIACAVVLKGRMISCHCLKLFSLSADSICICGPILFTDHIISVTQFWIHCTMWFEICHHFQTNLQLRESKISMDVGAQTHKSSSFYYILWATFMSLSSNVHTDLRFSRL